MRFFDFRLMGSLIFSLELWSIGPELPQIREVNLRIEHIFVPEGFDSNDTSEIIVTGWYPNPCYEWSRALVTRQATVIDVRLRAFVKEGLDTVCIDMAVPFMESVKLGALPAGQLNLLVANQTAQMKVTQAGSNSIDDYLYGKVRHVRVEGTSLILEIEHPSTCIVLDRIEHIYNGKDTCAILPIMKQVHEECPRTPRTFEYRFEIPKEYLEKEKLLFHVRSLEGKSVNYLFGD